MRAYLNKIIILLTATVVVIVCIISCSKKPDPPAPDVSKIYRYLEYDCQQDFGLFVRENQESEGKFIAAFGEANNPLVIWWNSSTLTAEYLQVDDVVENTILDQYHLTNWDKNTNPSSLYWLFSLRSG
ncbi:hypothetical protein HY768_05590 [candidate division TA06 bacterium]|uniref:Uncharacterized protein n=1 Tax=candidate division TA06 bacterium TaxID=2250710 RepID=A0A933I8R8_UNCT6|nr:hypothetical protein [candidate division TA06 bacterium]